VTRDGRPAGRPSGQGPPQHGGRGDQFRGTARPAWLVLAISHMSNPAPARLCIAWSGAVLPRRPARGLWPAAPGKLSWTAGPLVCGRRGHPVSYRRFLAFGRPGEPDHLPGPPRINTGGRRRTHAPAARMYQSSSRCSAAVRVRDVCRARRVAAHRAPAPGSGRSASPVLGAGP